MLGKPGKQAAAHFSDSLEKSLSSTALHALLRNWHLRLRPAAAAAAAAAAAREEGLRLRLSLAGLHTAAQCGVHKRRSDIGLDDDAGEEKKPQAEPDAVVRRRVIGAVPVRLAALDSR